MHITPMKPSGISLLATLRCTAACDNCCFGCNPKQGRSMTFEEMKDYVDKSLEAYPDSITKLCLTGGECMLLGKEVDKIISYVQSKGLNASIVSNAYWATDYDKAYRTLKGLKNKGLTSACFSTGEDHNRYVPWMNVRHAAVAAARLGIVTELRVENQLMHTEIIRELNADDEVTELVSKYKLQIVYPKCKIRLICITICQTVSSSIFFPFRFGGKNAKNDGKVKAFRYEYITCSGIPDILLVRLKQPENKVFLTKQE